MVKVTGVDHYVLNVSDARASLAWYCDHLGLEPVRLEEWEAGEALFVSVRIDEGTIIDLFETRPRRRQRRPRLPGGRRRRSRRAVAASGEFDVVAGPSRAVRGPGHRHRPVRARSRRQRGRAPPLRLTRSTRRAPATSGRVSVRVRRIGSACPVRADRFGRSTSGGVPRLAAMDFRRTSLAELSDQVQEPQPVGPGARRPRARADRGARAAAERLGRARRRPGHGRGHRHRRPAGLG